MSKRKLCDWGRRRIERKFDKLTLIVTPARFVCAKCARASRAKDHLCRPRQLVR